MLGSISFSAGTRSKGALRNGLLVAVCGISVGWLVGLSVSPVVHTIIESLLGIFVTSVSILAGLETKTDSQVTSEMSTDATKHGASSHKATIDLLPVTLFTVCLTIAASLGVLARTNGLLGPKPAYLVGPWENTGWTEQELTSRLFDQLYPREQTRAKDSTKEETSDSEVKNPVHNQLTGGLFAASVEKCDSVALKHGTELKTRLLTIVPEQDKDAIRRCTSSDCLEFAKEFICPAVR